MSEEHKNEDSLSQIFEGLVRIAFISLMFNIFFIYLPVSIIFAINNIYSNQILYFYHLCIWVNIFWILIGAIFYKVLKMEELKQMNKKESEKIE